MNRALVIGLTGAAATLLAACSASTTTTTPTPTAATIPVTSTPVATTAPQRRQPRCLPRWTFRDPGQGSTAARSAATHAHLDPIGRDLERDHRPLVPPKTLHVNGNVGGTAITFGAVGGVSFRARCRAIACPAATRFLAGARRYLERVEALT